MRDEIVLTVIDTTGRISIVLIHRPLIPTAMFIKIILYRLGRLSNPPVAAVHKNMYRLHMGNK